jgi:aldehyde dehydrogenase (NAD+)
MQPAAFNALDELSEDVRSRFFVDGRWVPARSDAKAILVSPMDEQPWLEAPLASREDVDQAVAAARRAFDFGPWPRMAPAQRAECLRRLAEELRQRLPLLSRLWTAQVGAPVTFADMFIGTGPAMFDYYADLLGRFPFEESRPSRLGHAVVRREPIGVAALITPWNGPFPILSYKLAAALASGCTTVVKSSPETPLDALVLAECALAAGFPEGVLNVLTADREEGAYLVASPLVDKVSFTGSTAAGKAVAHTCIERMARFTLELGGKSAAVILDDADLGQTLGALAPFTMPFSGQICFAQTRVLAPRSRVVEITEAYAGAMSHLTVGDPWAPETHLGPLASSRQLSKSLDYVAKGLADGARLVTGGERVAGLNRGYYMQPTVFTDVAPDMTIAREEIFGPVVVVQAYDDVDDAVRLANHSDFGLSGTVFTSDPARGYAVARRMKTGNVGVNQLDMAPGVPFGGYKQSGLGREGGPEGLEAFLEIQAVYMPGADRAAAKAQ